MYLAIPRGRLRMRGTGLSVSADEQEDKQCRKSAAIRAGVPSAIPSTIPRPGMATSTTFDRQQTRRSRIAGREDNFRTGILRVL